MITYRVAGYATPLRTVPSSQSGRFNVGDEDEPTQYLCLHPLGPLAELMRRAGLRTVDQVQAVRARTWAIDVRVDDLTELTFDSAEEFGIGADDLVSDDPRACQRLAQALRVAIPGLIAPSAALPGTRNVVLFGPRVAAPYLTEPVSTLDVPASITAEDARPLTSMVSLVRFVGDPHLAFNAWRRGNDFEFIEPDWSI